MTEGFKVACRDASGVMVTLIADNYFGYCQKDVKTQISSANLLGGRGGTCRRVGLSKLRRRGFVLSDYINNVDPPFRMSCEITAT